MRLDILPNIRLITNLLGLLVATYIAISPATVVGTTTMPAVMPPVLSCISSYESGINQFRADGSPIWSPTKDVGVMQIHYTWIPIAESMGLDVVNNATDNIEFGIWLYNTHGATQWTTYRQHCTQYG